MRILIVEDEKYIARAVAEVLKKNHFIVDLAHDGEYGLDCGLSDIYDVIVLDIMLPKRNGLSLLNELRKQCITTPVILLTAKSELDDKVKGLNNGADDYLTKPFHTEELLARIQALTRRKSDLHHTNIYSYFDIELDIGTLTLNNKTILQPKEAQILELLINAHGNIVSKEMIINKVWGYDSEAEYNHVEKHISLIRKKLSQLKTTGTIRTVRGLGYYIESGDKNSD